MDINLEEKIRRDGKRQKRYLRLYRRGEKYREYGTRGFWPFLDDSSFRNALSLVAHGAVLLILLCFFPKFLHAVIAYAVLHLVILGIGQLLCKGFGKKLDAMQEEYKQLREDYYRQMCGQHGIQDGCVPFDDGIVIGNGSMVATMRQSVGTLRIWQLSDWEENDHYKEYKRNLPKGTVTVNDYIASLEFRKKFGLKLECGTEKDCLKYLTPSVQVGMIKSGIMEKFLDLHICNTQLSAKLQEKIPLPTWVNVYEKKKLLRYFTEVDEYCRRLRTMADTAHRDFLKIDFLRGA